MSAGQLATLGLGIFVGGGVLIGALLGAIVGHFWLDNAFGWDQDVLVGAIVGTVIGVLLTWAAMKVITHRLSSN